MKKFIAKIYCSADELNAIEAPLDLIAKYDGFQIASVTTQSLNALRRRYPVEDITDQYALPLGGMSIDTSKSRHETRGRALPDPAYRKGKALRRGPHHYLVQFAGPVKKAWLSGVKKAGGEIRTPYQGFTFVVRADDQSLGRIVALPYVRWTGHLPHRARVAAGLIGPSQKLAPLPRTRRLPNAFTVEFFGTDDSRKAATAIRKLGIEILERDARGKVVTVFLPGMRKERREKLAALSAVHGVRFIRERTLQRPSNNVATGIMGTVASRGSSGLRLTGKGETIAICDTGLDTGNPSTIHPDFRGRVNAIKSYPLSTGLEKYITNSGANDGPADLDSGHGTHVAGSVLGNGTASAGVAGLTTTPVRGLAHEAKLVFQAVEQEIKWRPQYATDPDTGRPRERYALMGIPDNLGPLFTWAYNKGARIHSNSWGGGDPGAYDAQCEQFDQFVWTHKTFCFVIAAGNDGVDADANRSADGKINPGSVSSPGTAKNCITVGACENDRMEFNDQTYGKWWQRDFPKPPFKNDPMADNPDQVVAFSSRGPTADGRIKPDVIAPGTFILSTRSTQIAPNNSAWAAFPPSKMYFYMGGTSMATPLTSGGVALVRQFYRMAKKVPKPSAALVKATLICGATRLGGYAPLGSVADNHQGFGRVNLDAVLSPASPARMAFEDVDTGLNTGEIHEWRLKVKSSAVPLRVTLAYTDFPGPNLVNNLNLIMVAPDGTRYAGNQTPGAPLQPDSRNNVEVAVVPAPASGEWKVQVIGSNVPHGPQDFALVAVFS